LKTCKKSIFLYFRGRHSINFQIIHFINKVHVGEVLGALGELVEKLQLFLTGSAVIYFYLVSQTLGFSGVLH